MDTLPTAPWYASLVGTRWFSHQDYVVAHLHDVQDKYWDFINDSTIATTVCGIEVNGTPWPDTIVSSVKYSYDPDALECTLIFRNGGSDIYRLDTVQKTLTCDLPAGFSVDQFVYHLIED